MEQVSGLADVQPVDAIYFDADGMLAHEGFTSGLLLIIRELLRAFAKNEISAGVLSTVDIDRARFPESSRPGTRFRNESGVAIVEHIFRSGQAGQEEHVGEVTRKLLHKLAPRFIIMNSPAVFLNEVDVLYRQWANGTDAKVIHVVADHLFPTTQSHDPGMVSRLYDEMRRGTAITLTESIQRKFFEASRMHSTRFKNPFVLNEILATTGGGDSRKRIGMVNLHPIKGRQIFHEVARRMSDHDFLIVKNWPDIDEYEPLPNVTVAEFHPRPRDLYRDLSVLLVPSLHEDGPTRVIIEAMLNRIPVIANRIGSIPDAGAENAVFIDPPQIFGFDLKGDVLVPRLEPASLDRCVSDYCRAVELVIANPPAVVDQINRAHKMALSYVNDSQRILDNLVATWVGTPGSGRRPDSDRDTGDD